MNQRAKDLLEFTNMLRAALAPMPWYLRAWRRMRSLFRFRRKPLIQSAGFQEKDVNKTIRFSDGSEFEIVERIDSQTVRIADKSTLTIP